MSYTKVNLIRYPGGKLRILNYIIQLLPSKEMIKNRYIEPFLGSGAVFFALNPKRAILADINSELIDLYRGVCRYPLKVWEIYKSFPETKEAYYEIRDLDTDKMSLPFKAARTLFLNRTCFKGMWRHNSKGQFNVGYGGQDRRWAINLDVLMEVSKRLRRAILKCADFEETIEESQEGDFIFIDPPYKPGKRELLHSHYLYGKFRYCDYERLAKVLRKATSRGVIWAMTISSHPDILSLFPQNYIFPLRIGVGEKPGVLTYEVGEVIILNYNPEELQISDIIT